MLLTPSKLGTKRELRTLAACEKAAIEDGAGNGSSVGKGRSVCL